MTWCEQRCATLYLLCKTAHEKGMRRRRNNNNNLTICLNFHLNIAFINFGVKKGEVYYKRINQLICVFKCWMLGYGLYKWHRSFIVIKKIYNSNKFFFYHKEYHLIYLILNFELFRNRILFCLQHVPVTTYIFASFQI